MKKRLDLILFEKGYFETKNAAAAAILAGNVKIGEKIVDKAGEQFDPDKLFDPEQKEKIEIKVMPYVSRGGLKLEGAIKAFNINLKDRICIDMGASTGGFTDCMLQFGAKKVYAIDVGYNQLAWKLREDKRVVSKEKTNVKNCTFFDIFGAETIEESEMPNFMSMDLSFISIKKVLDNIINFVQKNSEFVFLIKPQFEAKREEIQKGGVVRDEKIHNKIIEDIKEYAKNLGLDFQGVIKSPIQGAKQGNVEYLIYFKRGEI